MTDLEMTKRCAEKMGWKHYGLASKTVCYKVSKCAIIADNDKGGDQVYDPLHDDAQAMALVKKFSLIIEPTDVVDGIGSATDWWVQAWINDEVRWKGVENKDLNRAIVECVAKMSGWYNHPIIRSRK